MQPKFILCSCVPLCPHPHLVHFNHLFLIFIYLSSIKLIKCARLHRFWYTKFGYGMAKPSPDKRCEMAWIVLKQSGSNMVHHMECGRTQTDNIFHAINELLMRVSKWDKQISTQRRIENRKKEMIKLFPFCYQRSRQPNEFVHGWMLCLCMCVYVC